MTEYTWEEAVIWLRQQSDQQQVVRDCYFDDPLITAAERYYESMEWQMIRSLLPQNKGTVLDIGAGRGITSNAFALDGWQVTALEPNSSNLIGSGAIRELANLNHLNIDVVEEFGENLPFESNYFDLVFCREVLHHAKDLGQFCLEAARVLKTGGHLIAVREHVISHPEDLPIFLSQHSLDHLYHGENAYLLEEYLAKIKGAKLRVKNILATYQSAINYFPMTREQRNDVLRSPFNRRIGKTLTSIFTQENRCYGKRILEIWAYIYSKRLQTPGRLYSFVALKV